MYTLIKLNEEIELDPQGDIWLSVSSIYSANGIIQSLDVCLIYQMQYRNYRGGVCIKVMVLTLIIVRRPIINIW